MPEVSRFYGIVVRMFYNDHAPPHFHAVYSGKQALVDIESLSFFAGQISPRAKSLVLEWAELHQDELRANWDLARRRQALQSIDPLP